MSNLSSPSLPKKAPSALRLLSLVLLLIAVSVTIWSLTSSNLFSSPNQTLTNLDASLARGSKLFLQKWQALFPSKHRPAQLPEESASRQYFLQADPSSINNLHGITAVIEALNKQVGKEKDSPLYHNRLGILYAQIGEFGQAIQHLKQAVLLCRQQLAALDNARAKNGATSLSGEDQSGKDQSAIYVQLDCAHSNLARIYDKLGDQKKVISELEELNRDIVFAGDIPSINRTVLKVENKKPRQSANNQRLTPQEAAILARAEALRQVGRLPQAVQEYIKLINLNPKLAIAHQRLGLAAVSDNNLWLAINELQIAAQLDKSDPDTLNDLGLIYEQIGDFKSAKQAFANAHKANPKHLSASINLANILASAGDYKSGIAIMRQATKDHPNSPIAHNNLAALIARTKNQTEAAKEFAKAINLNPDLASAHYGLGIALLKLKSYTAAAKEFQTAITLNPGILDLQNKIDLANRCNLRTLAYTQSSFE